MSREKYPEFVVTRTYRRAPKKRQTNGVDGYGMCEYSYLQCAHCDDELELLSSSLKFCKANVIRDHLCVCVGYTGERPTRRGSKAAAISTALAPYQCANPAHTTLAEDVAKGYESVPKTRKKIQKTVDTHLVTIYKVIYKPEDRVVYTGQTKTKLEDRLKRHASRKSGCRLVRNAIRRHGMRKFAIEPIVRCRPDDADANESYYIISNNTLHPNGYNLRHGSKAGDDSTDAMQVVPLAHKSDSCEDDPRAYCDAITDLASMCDDPEASEDEDAEAMSLALLTEVHPVSDLKTLCD